MWLYLIIFLALVVGLIYLVQLYLSGNNSYWPKKGVALVKPGEAASIFELLTKRKTIVGMDEEYYKKFKALGVKFGGIMEFRRPIVYVIDLDLVKQILVKDFDHFVDRRKFELGNEPILRNMLTILEGQEWKDVRAVMSPTFTTGKIKRMFKHFNECGKSLHEYVKAKPELSEGSGEYKIIVQDVVSRFAVDVIGSTAFGMQTCALKDPDSIFYKMARLSSDITFSKITKGFFSLFAPKLASLLRFSIVEPVSVGFFTAILTTALKEREISNEKRDDFLQLMIEARKGELKTDESELDTFEKDAEIKSQTKSKIQLTDDVVIAQCVLFFVAGFDTVGSLVSFAAYLLAIHQDMQEKIFDEVEKYIDQKTGDIEYDDVGKLGYLDMFISGWWGLYTYTYMTL
jgi:cytochrome P450 family 9